MLAYSASYGQTTGTLAVPAGLNDLQAYNLIATLPPQQNNQAHTNLLNHNAMHSHNHTNNNHLVNTAALMRNYISPGTSTMQTIKTHNGNLISIPRQIIKLEVSSSTKMFNTFQNNIYLFFKN